MIRAKNYKSVTKFVKVMPRILWPLFSWTRCITLVLWSYLAPFRRYCRFLCFWPHPYSTLFWGCFRWTRSSTL